MHFSETDGYAEGAGANSGGLGGVILLALLLCGVFFLAVGAYGAMADGGVAEGDLPNAVLALRELVAENETVAVFLGFSEEDAQSSGGLVDAGAAERIQAAADAYIKEHQP